MRQGKRLASLTPAGEIVVATARRALREIANLKRVADEFRGEDTGTLSIATTHTQARYVLPKVICASSPRAFRRCGWCCTRATRVQVAEQTAARRRRRRHRHRSARPTIRSSSRCPATSGIACVIVPQAAIRSRKMQPLTLEALAQHPIVTYDFSFTGRSAINAAFAAKGLEPNVVLTALDADVIKTYVELGMGVGHHRADGLRSRARTPRSRCSTPATCSPRRPRGSALRRGVFLRGYVYRFIALFAPQYDRAAVDAALAGTVAPAEL